MLMVCSVLVVGFGAVKLDLKTKTKKGVVSNYLPKN